MRCLTKESVNTATRSCARMCVCVCVQRMPHRGLSDTSALEIPSRGGSRLNSLRIWTGVWTLRSAPIENLWGIVKRKMKNKRPKNADELKVNVIETWASIPPQQCHKLITSMPRRIEAVIKAKGAPTKY